MASKTDFDSIISFPHEETGSERENDFLSQNTMTQLMSELCLGIQEKYSEKDQTGLYNQMTHVGSIEIYFDDIDI